MRLQYQSAAKRYCATIILAVMLRANMNILGQETARPVITNSRASNFEVVSLKPVDPRANSTLRPLLGVNISAGCTLTINGVTLKDLVSIAFALPYAQIEVTSKWQQDERYDLRAKPSEAFARNCSSPRFGLFTIEDEVMRLMLQAALSERFDLKYEKQTTTGKVYSLLINQKYSGGKGGLLTRWIADPATGGQGSIGRSSGRGWMIYNTSMQELAQFISAYVVHAPVRNDTNLKGLYSHESRFIQTDTDIQNLELQETFLAFVTEIGLKLIPIQGPIEHLVVTSANKPAMD